jgi:8-amino-7-oxononanoate synthase
MSRIDPIERLIATRNQRQAEGLLRRLRTIGGNDGAYTVVDGRRLLNFSSNDYLGLAGHRLLVAALQQAADAHGVGAGDLCVQDKLNHACLLDGARLAGCTLKRYAHGNVDAANRQLANADAGAAMLATDGVFSMDGDIAPLRELAALAREQRATLLVDDAHGIGVLGADGAGSVAEAGLDCVDVPILMATLGKAVGTAGAFVAGSAALIDALKQFARTYVYTTAMPPALAAASLAAVGIARKDAWRREQLAMLVDRFRAGALAMGVSLGESRTPVQPILVGSAERAVDLAAALEEEGLLAIAIRPPTVPPGGARLRITFTALHQAGDVDRLLQALESHAPHWR